MASKIRVYGEAQNRTALGIIHAYMKLFPDATLADLRKAFPDALAPDKGVAEIFVDSKTDGNGEHYFMADDELVTLADGTKVAVVRLWTKPSYDNLVKMASRYGIEVAEFEQQQHVGKKGAFYIDYIDGYLPPYDPVKDGPDGVVVPPPVETVAEYEEDRTKRGGLGWLWLLLALIALFIIAILLGRSCGRQEEASGMAENLAYVADTTTAAATTATNTAVTETAAADATRADVVASIESYQKQFDAIEYPVGEYQLKPAAKTILDNVAALLKKYPSVKLTVNGYASREGNQDANRVLSQKRAATVVDYLKAQGIDGGRLKAAGLSTSNPVSSELSPNRRIDFVVE